MFDLKSIFSTETTDSSTTVANTWYNSVCDGLSTAYDYTIAPVVNTFNEGWAQVFEMDKVMSWEGVLVAVSTWIVDILLCGVLAYFFPAALVYLVIFEALMIAYKAYRLYRRYGITLAASLA